MQSGHRISIARLVGMQAEEQGQVWVQGREPAPEEQEIGAGVLERVHWIGSKVGGPLSKMVTITM